ASDMPAPARKIRDADDADACLAALHASGLPLKAWANAHGIDGRSLNMWRLNRQRTTVAPPASTPFRLVELLPVERPEPVADFRVHIDDLVVCVPAGFDADALGRLVAVLRRC
ncbi:MAG: hypothetical protein H6697_12500, partial [Myxococcales bacterium]|nr:hypothetical protein [Myxococcales bacterium]